MTETIDFAAQARLVSQLAAQTADEQLDAPTPCEAYAVRHLLGHLVGLSAGIPASARKNLGATTSTSTRLRRCRTWSPDGAAELDRNLRGMAEAWHGAGGLGGRDPGGRGTLPAAIAGRFALNELVLHGWDLARATGQDYRPTRRASGSRMRCSCRWPRAPDRVPVFGAPVAVGADAPLLDQVVALSGRRPDWAPPGS